MSGLEFACTGCGRWIVAFPADDPVWAGERCSACQTLPQWYRDPQLRRIIEPDPHWLPPASEAEPS